MNKPQCRARQSGRQKNRERVVAMMETITNMIYHAQMGLCNTTMLLRWFRWFHLYNYSFLKAIFVVFFGKSNAALDITYVQKFTKSTSINPNDSY